MVIFLYDGTFEGLLTAIYEGWYNPRKPDRIELPDHRQEGLLDEAIWIETDSAKAEKVSGAISNKLSKEILEHVLYAWLSEDTAAGTVVYRFLRHAFKVGPACIGSEAHPEVNPLLRLSRSVTRESHRLLGLVRFMELDNGIYYSRFEPDFNVLMILASHFAQRLGEQVWVLHDSRRGIAAFYNKESWHIAEVSPPKDLQLHENEKEMQACWQEYFRRIAIKERFNPKLQRQMMPKKYWRYLVEKQID